MQWISTSLPLDLPLKVGLDGYNPMFQSIHSLYLAFLGVASPLAELSCKHFSPTLTTRKVSLVVSDPHSMVVAGNRATHGISPGQVPPPQTSSLYQMMPFRHDWHTFPIQFLVSRRAGTGTCTMNSESDLILTISLALNASHRSKARI